MMTTRTQNRLTIVLGALCLVVAATSTSYAAGMITGRSIQNGTVTTADVKDNTLKTKDLSPTVRAGLKGTAGPAGPAGPPGQRGPAGQQGETGPAGPSHVIAVSRDSYYTVAPELKPVLMATVTPGSWTVSAKSFGERVGSSDSSFYACDLVAGPLKDSNIVTLAPPVNWSSMSHQLSFNTAIEVPVVLYCRGGSATVNGATLTAIEVGSVDRQPYPPPG